MTKKYSSLAITGTLLSFLVSPIATFASTQLSPTGMNTPTLIPTTGVTIVTPTDTDMEAEVTAYPTFVPTVGTMTTSTTVGTSTITQGVPAVGSLDDDPGTGTGTTRNTNTAGTVDNDDGFNWWWLLPLLAIPVLVYALRDRGDYAQPNIDNRQMSMGVKGGRATTDETIKRDRVDDDDL